MKTEEGLIAGSLRSLRRAYANGDMSKYEYAAGVEQIRNLDKPKQKEKDRGNFRKEALRQ